LHPPAAPPSKRAGLLPDVRDGAEACGFAHGSSDFNAKRELCTKAGTGCVYGERCSFRHQKKEQLPMLPVKLLGD